MKIVIAVVLSLASCLTTFPLTNASLLFRASKNNEASELLKTDETTSEIPEGQGRRKLSMEEQGLASGLDLANEMRQLQGALQNLQFLLEEAAPDDPVIMDRAAKLFRRARWLVYASSDPDMKSSGWKKNRGSHHYQQEQQQQDRNEEVRMNMEEEQHQQEWTGNERLRKDEQPWLYANDTERAVTVENGEQQQQDDDPARRMYEATITFPECQEKLLTDCLEIIAQELTQLEMECEIIIHEKRNIHQSGYNKVVIVTDLTATLVKGRNNDGIVDYPFLWDDSKYGLMTLGVDGKWDCLHLTPEDCCNKIKDSVPGPDVKGNMLECHIFVPFGGTGNKKRTDRVFVNLSPDGRVQEPPVVQ